LRDSLFDEFADGAYAITSRAANKMEEMTMSSPQDSGTTSPTSGGQLEDAVTTFSDAVFEATQGLLKAQQELTRALLSSRAGQAQDETDEADDELAETDEADEADEAPPVQRRRPRPATGGRRTTSRAAN
jgi:hypothetical protein